MKTSVFSSDLSDVSALQCSDGIVSVGDMKYHAPAIEEMNVPLPKVTIFGAHETFAFQMHDVFRFVERESLIGLSNYSPLTDRMSSHARYYSDGLKGKLVFK